MVWWANTLNHQTLVTTVTLTTCTVGAIVSHKGALRIAIKVKVQQQHKVN